MTWSRWVYVTGVSLIALAFAVWLATGREGYTRWPDERLAKADAPPAPGEADLLAGAGFSDGAPARPDLQSRFALGLVPGGFDARHVLSVATIAGVVAIVTGVTGAVRRIRRVEAGGTNGKGVHT